MENIHRNGQTADRRRRNGTMSNTYRDYMNRLRLALADFDPEYSSEILEDFEAHFTRSMENGKSEADGSCDSVTLSSTNGSLMFHGKAEKTLQCKTVNGKIQIHYAKPEHGASLSLSTTWGGIRADFNQSQISGRKNFQTSYGSGALSVTAHTVNGGIRLQEI